MPSINTFERDFLNIYAPGPSPEKNMHFEQTEFIDRYIGPGKAAFYYALTLKKPCSQEQLIDLINQEIKLAQQRDRHALELRLYPIPKLNFSFDNLNLESLGFKPPRILNFFYAPTQALKTKPSTSIHNQRVDNEKDFKLLFSLLEQIFGPASQTLVDYLNSGLQHEVKDYRDKVAAYITFIDNTPAGIGWVKLYNKIGFLFGGGTLKKWRQHGIYRANTLARINFAHEHRGRFVASCSSEDGTLALNNMNFNLLGKQHSWVYRFKN